jgi:putative molybdopterin biosynthesis protein
MSIYLHDIPLEKAQERFWQALEEAGLGRVLGVEEIHLDEYAIGRVLAEPAWAKLSHPHYHASAMDGFAVRSEYTIDALPSRPTQLKMGSQAAYVDTGDPLPEWADAVIPIENVEPITLAGEISPEPRHPDLIRIRAAVPPWRHIRPMVEDIVATQLVLPEGHTLRPVDLGALAASGISHLRVSRKPRVAILPTGSELVAVGQPVKPGEIIEFNSIMLASQVNQWGGQAERLPITVDDFEKICSTTSQAAERSDLVLINAGSSAGSEDFTSRTVEELGELLVHGVAVRPGHPVILGMLQVKEKDLQRQVPVIGVPGYPVSAALTAEIFIEPLLARWLGREAHQPSVIEAKLTRKVTSPAGDADYMRVVVGRVGENLLASPLSRGAGVITSLTRADGIVVLPPGVQGLEAGAPVKVRLYRNPAELEKTIFAIGSHDLTLDLLSQYLAPLGRRLASSNAGSLGGLVALRRGEAHLAGSHLLDPETGEYNLPAIRQYLPGVPVAVYGWVGRSQGLLVQKRNPKEIHSLADLARPDVTMINRQRGAGTRVLLDYHLAQLGIDPQQVRGYEHEEYTHLAVAAAISSGRADTGLGVAAAAQALDLDFVPLYQERYELVIPQEFLEGDFLKPIFDLARREDFRRAVAKLPGYDVACMGEKLADVG